MKYIALLACGLMLFAAPQKKADPELSLQAAIQTETVDGDLKSAIEQYKKVIAQAGTNRHVKAMALVHMAACYQKMGDAESRKIYEQVVKEYADQTEAVTLARARLGANSSARESGIVARQIWTEADEVGGEASLAPDGRTMAMLVSSGDVAIRDVSTGQVTRMMFVPDPRGGYAEWPSLSPDLRQVAYAWSSPEDGNYQVRVADAQPGAKPRILVRNSEFLYYFLRAWSHDGKSVLAIVLSEGNMSQLAWISVADGAVKTLKSMEWRGPGLVSLSPDGRFIVYDALARQDSTDREIRILAADASTETVLVNASGSNAAPVWTRDGAHVLFLSRRSGSFGLWAVPVRDGKPAGPVELVKPDTGSITPVGFTRTGSFLYTQAVGHQDVFAVQIDPASGKVRGNPVRLVDTYVGANRNPAWSPDGKSIAYLSRRSGSIDNTSPGTLVIQSLETGQEKTIPTAFTYGGQPMWFPDGQSILEGSRNSQNHTSFYKVDLKTGGVRELINMGTAAPPAMALSPDAKTVFAAPLDQKPGIVAAFDLATGHRTNIYAAANPIFSIAASPDGSKVAFVAEKRAGSGQRGPSHLYVTNPDGSNPRDLFAVHHQDANVTAIAWAPDSRSLYFVRSDDPSIGRPHESHLWRISANGETQEDTGFSDRNIGFIDFSRDGTRLAYGRGELAQAEYWSLDNLERMWKASSK